MRKIFRLLKTCALAGLGVFMCLQVFLAIKYFPTDKVTLQPIASETKSLHGLGHISARKVIEPDDEELISKKQPNFSLVNQKSPTQLRIEELDFVPVCLVTNKEAISATHRAKTQNCKQQIVNASCAINSGKFYPKELPHFCSRKEQLHGTIIGCYEDNKKNRILSSYYANFLNDNSPSHCLYICLQAGFPYAGVQYSTECFCGDVPPSLEFKLDDTACNMKCPANTKENCGGYFAMNVYHTGISKFTPITPNIAQEDTLPDIRIVFLLTLNGRALRQVRRLINVIYNAKHYYYIHVDVRQDYLHRELQDLEKQFNNVRLAKKRFATIWGGASLLQMLLTSMSDFGDWHWDFVINLSESDFPIKSMKQLEQFLNVNRDMNFVKSHGREVQRFIKKQGLDKTFLECDTHMWRIGDRKLPKGIVIDGGSDWVALSRNFVKYLLGPKDELLKGLEVIFNHTLLPAESYFHTVLRNTPFCNTYIDNNLHVTNWKRKLGCKCQYKHVVDWCGCSPNDFKTDDWLRIQGTQEKQLFFARKFEAVINQEIIKRVEQSIGFDDHFDLPNVDSFWQSIYHRYDSYSVQNDLLLTHSESILRQNMNLFSERKCHIEFREFIELSSYHNFDTYKGNIITYSIAVGNQSMIMETWYKPQRNININVRNKYHDNINTFIVSSEYDQKEQVFRNFANILGPFSEPTLLYQLNAMIDPVFSKNYSVIWLDPLGVIAEINQIQIDEYNLTNTIKTSIKTPLLPGIWKVGLVDKNIWLMQTSFLVTPLQYFSGKEISSEQATIVNGGSLNTYKFKHNVDVINFVPDSLEKDTKNKLVLSNLKRYGNDLKDWIDSLNVMFYSVLGSCVQLDQKFNTNRCGDIKFELCNSSDWSSLSPDPKGTIGKLDKQTGILERL